MDELDRDGSVKAVTLDLREDPMPSAACLVVSCDFSQPSNHPIRALDDEPELSSQSNERSSVCYV